ncbi:hypothetical protein DY000_02040122 [Brassica cretica]|uniref:Uncharacterized protein n=1 Tax=Brassica cretica TaxID=69181 RepID=A0ABQ7BQL5_BRACR|nr:hypothetical protein DY000_02040122 [Brassica cretica]
MRRKTVPMNKVVWEFNGKDVITWETVARMKAQYPEWYSQFLPDETSNLDSGTNPLSYDLETSVPWSEMMVKDVRQQTLNQDTMETRKYSGKIPRER